MPQFHGAYYFYKAVIPHTWQGFIKTHRSSGTVTNGKCIQPVVLS